MVRKSTWIILAVFIVLLLISLFQNKTWNSKEIPKTPSPTPVKLALPADILADLSEISYKNAGGEMLAISRNKGGKWSFSSEPQTVVSVSRMNELLANLESLEIISKLNSSSIGNELGLSPANQKIVLKDSKGIKSVISIGSLTPTGSGYYLQIDNSLSIVRKGSMETIFGLFTRENLVIPQTSSP